LSCTAHPTRQGSVTADNKTAACVAIPGELEKCRTLPLDASQNDACGVALQVSLIDS